VAENAHESKDFTVQMLTQRCGFDGAMASRGLPIVAGFGLAALVLVSALMAGGQTSVQRISFVIATGPTGGSYFPIGEAIAALISHPPGVYRCEQAGVCGPSGLIGSARTSPGAVANVLAVNSQMVDSALAQSDVIVEGVAGKGVFQQAGRQSHVRAIAALYPEDVHVVATKASHIHAVGDLKGKRVSLGPATSGTSVTAGAILAAYRLSTAGMKINRDPSEVAAAKLDKGQLDAMFFVGGAPVPLVRELLASGGAVLVPIDGKSRERLLAQAKTLSADSIPAGLYPNAGKIETVSVRAVWIVNQSEPDVVVHGIAKALFNPANRDMLAGSHRSAQFIRIDSAAANLPVPLHPGAARFYAEMGKLPKAVRASGKP
jgi:TRAP transporter TAXI family solute receptor